ncbi:MAG TPA: hypothetical protein PLG20_09015, partial [Candidatus Syntrophosphaera sp.]|nr:hypothetical protein [Candidatus Syntrophosphaera sp.]
LVEVRDVSKDLVYLAGNFQSAVGFGDEVLTTNGVYDIFVAKLEGTAPAPGIPLTPQDIRIARTPAGVIWLAWDAVTQDTNGNPITPTYAIYQSADPYGGWSLLGTTADTSFTFFPAELHNAWFCYIAAVAP